MAISATLKHLNIIFFKTIELHNLHHNFVNGFTSYGGSIVVVMNDYMVHLNVLALRSNDDSDKIEEDCSQLVFVSVCSGFLEGQGVEQIFPPHLVGASIEDKLSPWHP
jgi:hypothetical protein